MDRKEETSYPSTSRWNAPLVPPSASLQGDIPTIIFDTDTYTWDCGYNPWHPAHYSLSSHCLLHSTASPPHSNYHWPDYYDGAWPDCSADLGLRRADTLRRRRTLPRRTNRKNCTRGSWWELSVKRNKGHRINCSAFKSELFFRHSQKYIVPQGKKFEKRVQIALFLKCIQYKMWFFFFFWNLNEISTKLLGWF